MSKWKASYDSDQKYKKEREKKYPPALFETHLF